MLAGLGFPGRLDLTPLGRVEEKALPSRGTTEPGTELAGEASASNTLSSSGCTAFSAWAT